MGDWNTLHYFDRHSYCAHPVTDLLQKYYRSAWGQSRFIRPTEQRLQAMLALVGPLQDGFALPAGGATSSDSEQAIEDVNRLLPLVVFAEFTFFRPRFRLGKSLLSDCATYTRPNTLLEETLERFSSQTRGVSWRLIAMALKTGLRPRNWHSPCWTRIHWWGAGGIAALYRRVEAVLPA